MFYEVTLIRHGESNGNAAGVSMGFTPGYLTETGRHQAKMLNQSLREFFPSFDVFDGIYCSDLRRCVFPADI
jgi:broad specificity phosphatase PhoE